PTRSRLGFLDKFAEAQHDAALICINDVKTACQPYRHDQRNQPSDTAPEAEHAGTATGGRPLAISAIAYSGPRLQFLLEIAHHFIEVGRVVERHQCTEHAAHFFSDKSATGPPVGEHILNEFRVK